jgi:outer membrane protein TolC
VTVAAGYVNGVDGGTVVGGPAISLSMQIPLSSIAGARIAAQEASVRTAEAKRDGVRRALALEVGAAARTAAAAIIARSQTQASLEAATSYLNYASTQYKTANGGGMMVKDATDIYRQAVVDDIAAEYAVLAAQATLDIELSP